MSLVLEALRRVEKPDAQRGSVGVAVSSYRPTRGRPGALMPLLLGLGAGGALIVFFKTQVRDPVSQEVLSGVVTPAPLARIRPPLPPMRLADPLLRPRPVQPASDAAASGLKTPPALSLQAISERDSHPIAIINDQLVKEGDLLGTARILRIAVDSVEVLFENGEKGTIRFAPPPPPEPTASPDQG